MEASLCLTRAPLLRPVLTLGSVRWGDVEALQGA